MTQTIFRVLAIIAMLSSGLSAQTFEIRSQNGGNGLIVVEMRATSPALVPNTSLDLTDLVFIIKWPSSYNVDLEAINNTGNFNIGKSDGRSTSGSFHYQSFAANSLPMKFPSNWVLNQWIEIMRIANTLDGTGTGTFEIAEANFGEALSISDLNLGIDLEDYTPTISGAAAGVSLPVQLTQFQAQAKEMDAQLTWQTAAEQNFSHYDIERSADQRVWQPVGKVVGQGDTHTTADYRWTDTGALRQATTGHLYYRLKMVDTDATFAYSPIRSVRVPASGQTVRIQPNPATDALHITLPGLDTDARITATLYDSTGKRVLQSVYQVATPLNISTLPRGTYTLQLTDPSGVLATEQVVVQ